MRRAALVPLVAVALVLAACGPAAPPAMPLAFVGADEQVYTYDVAGGPARRVSSTSLLPPPYAASVTYQWPTWSPDGQQLAYLQFARNAGGQSGSAVIVSRADGSHAHEVFENEPGGTLVTPFYLSWAPDGSQIALGAQRGSSAAVLLLDPTGGRDPQFVTTGSPVFYAWAPNSRSLLVHPFGSARANPRAEVALFHVERTWDERFVLPVRPVGFHTPAWSPDGAHAAVATEQPGQGARLLVFDTASGLATPLLEVTRAPSFTWSPDGSRLALMQRENDTKPFAPALDVVSAADGSRVRVADGNISAFFWSPDGHRIAFARFHDQGGPGTTWWIVDADGHNPVRLGSYLPDDDSFVLLLFFDQYAQSMSPWSPDGKYFTFSGSPVGEPSGPSHVYVAPTDGSSPPYALAEGHMPAWPAPPPRLARG